MSIINENIYNNIYKTERISILPMKKAQTSKILELF